METEARFISPDERCRHPERWHSFDGDATEDEVGDLIAGLVRGLQPDVVVETGSAWGHTTLKIADALDRNGYGIVYALEVEPERIAATRQRVAHTSRAVVVEESSLEWTPPDEIDLLFSDSNYEHRIPEYLRFRGWLRVGATVVFHDTRPGAGEHRIGEPLRDEIDRLVTLKSVHLPTPRGVTICEVI